MSQTIFKTAAVLVALLMFCAAGCRRSTEFSSVLQGGFDPGAMFRQRGYTVQNEARGESIRNPVHGYGWQSWCGVLTSAEQPLKTEDLAVVIRDELNKALGGAFALDELTGRGRSDRQPLLGLLRYNKDRMHGDLHVWLTPDASQSSVCYVIFLREERLK